MCADNGAAFMGPVWSRNLYWKTAPRDHLTPEEAGWKIMLFLAATGLTQMLTASCILALHFEHHSY